ncbi:MAG: DUF503 domain-containing protein [Anaerolineae bacterium]
MSDLRGMLMVVGVCTIQLRLPTAGSLKDKRRTVKSLTTQIRNRFNVSIAEVDFHDVWGTAEIGVACVSNDGRHAHAVLSEVVKMIEGARLDHILVDYSIELVTY